MSSCFFGYNGIRLDRPVSGISKPRREQQNPLTRGKKTEEKNAVYFFLFLLSPLADFASVTDYDSLSGLYNVVISRRGMVSMFYRYIFAYPWGIGLKKKKFLDFILSKNCCSCEKKKCTLDP